MDQVTEDSLNSPIFFKYLKAFQENPKSLVFAPLAETYRKTGMVDKALEVLREGLRHHGEYLMGHLVLAHCHYDLGKFDQAYNVIRPFILAHKDNIRLQKLYADICIELGKNDEALDTLKYLLFLNSKDKEIAQKVEMLEKKESLSEVVSESKKILQQGDQAENGTELHNSDDLLFEERNLKTTSSVSENYEENWTQVDFIQRPRTHFETDDISVYKTEIDKSTPEEEDRVSSESEPASEQIQNIPTKIETNDRPVLTHTLADLYMAQGHLDKAKEILTKVLELNPNDERTSNKLSEVEFLISQKEQFSSDRVKPEVELRDAERVVETEEAGRQALMALYESANAPDIEVESTNDILAKLDHSLGLFLQAIHNKAGNYRKSREY